MSNYKFKNLNIEGVILVEPKVFHDERGFFMESYTKSEFAKNGIDIEFKQDNYSYSKKCVLRGLHYQTAPRIQAKLVRCVKGSIYDVAVDIRKNSKTFGNWVGEVLSEENNKMLFIPEGFAHGFVTLSDTSKVLYKVSEEFSPKHDGGIFWNDPDVKIDWKIDFQPVLSDKDKNQPLLKDIKELL